jgi:hypothetical protein
MLNWYYTVDAETQFATYSDRVKELFGLSDDSQDLNKILEHIIEEDREKVITTIADTYHNKSHDISEFSNVIAIKMSARRCLGILKNRKHMFEYVCEQR